MTAAGSDHLSEAGHAEQAGDLAGAVAHLRSHLAQHAEDATARLHLGQLLFTLGEGKAARAVLAELDGGGAGASDASAFAELSSRANRLLALLDERDGALTAAEIRWERLLATDIDDPEAQRHLRALRPQAPRGSRDLSLGTLVAPAGVRTSRFRLLRELGRGSTATVYLVRDERLDLPLALKVLHPHLAGAAREEARGRFFAEARVAARLRHPGVVAIYDLDEATRSLVMEYVEGGTVRQGLRESAGRPLDSALLRRFARSLLRALAYVHGAGVVHGDLKPGNLLLRSPGDVVLADFGGARLAGAGPAGQGTPLYLAPEQFRGAPSSAATDLFAAGAILWELAAGRPARQPQDLLANPQAVPPLPADALREPGAAPVRAVIDALIAAEPSRRPASAAAALEALDRP